MLLPIHAGELHFFAAWISAHGGGCSNRIILACYCILLWSLPAQEDEIVEISPMRRRLFQPAGDFQICSLLILWWICHRALWIFSAKDNASLLSNHVKNDV